MDEMPEYPYIDSRYSDPREMDELNNFVAALRLWKLKYKVKRVFYDSKVNLCEITLDPDIDAPTEDLIFALVDDHVGQYLRDGVVCHGKPMADWYDLDRDLDNEADIDGEEEPDQCVLAGDDDEGQEEPAGSAMAGIAAPVQALHWDEHRQTLAGQRALAGLEGERALAEWFEREGLSYVAVCQQPETFASLFSGAVKRPDFLLLFDALGMIGVDAKNLSPNEWRGRLFYSLTLDDELKKAVAFERVFRMPVWYAIKGRDEWLWISALKAVEVGRTFQNSTTKANFVSIGKQHFVHVRTGDDLAGLYAQRMPSYQRVAALTG